MYYYEVAPTKIIRAHSNVFTYASETPLVAGHIVTIEVGRQQLTGLVVRGAQKPAYDTKQILSVIETTPLPQPLVALSLWLADYYGSHLATVLQTILPRGLTN